MCGAVTLMHKFPNTSQIVSVADVSCIVQPIEDAKCILSYMYAFQMLELAWAIWKSKTRTAWSLIRRSGT